MVSYRPLGVTILAAIIIITYSVIFIAGLMLLLGMNTIPTAVASREISSVVGIIFLIWAFVRLSMGFGLLRLRRKAWRSAMIVFGVGLLIDLIFVPQQVLLDIIILVYLIIVKQHFEY
jgi:hypothetical protein